MHVCCTQRTGEHGPKGVHKALWSYLGNNWSADCRRLAPTPEQVLQIEKSPKVFD